MALSESYYEKDQANKRKPVEIYRFWNDSLDAAWYYTSGDSNFVYPATGGATYEAATFKRSRSAFHTDLNISKMTIDVSRLNPAFSNYLTQPMPEMIWIEVAKLFRDQDPLEKRVIFIGQVANVKYNGVKGTIECHGFEKFLKMKIPTMRYQPTCNLKLYSDQCAVALTSYGGTVSAIESISSNGLQITDSAFSGEDDGYYTLGYIKWGNYKRTITNHVGSVITIQFYIPGLIGGEDIYAAPGCNKSMDACRDKYNNLGNGDLDRFLGFRYMPFDNPATWVN
jgi:uncharacterized phage protein (TIGR02218 family)